MGWPASDKGCLPLLSVSDGCWVVGANCYSAEGTSFETRRPLVIPIKNIPAVFTGDLNLGHDLGF
jgi:hypothetical protein